MGLLQDLLKEVPLSAVLKERVALAEQKFDQVDKENQRLRQRVANLEKEVSDLHAQLPCEPAQGLDEDTCRVLVYLFRAQDQKRDVGALAGHLQIEHGVAEYYLERLNELGLALRTGGNYRYGHTYWGLTTQGRQYVVENDLVPK